MDALIVDTPLIGVYQVIGTNPRIENKEKIMPIVITSLVRKYIIELFEDT